MRKNRFVILVILGALLVGMLCSCIDNEVNQIDAENPSVNDGIGDVEDGGNDGDSDNDGDSGNDGNVDSDTNDALNGKYGLHHIVVENISSGAEETYQLGELYYGMLLSADTISVTMNNGTGVMSYVFEQSVTTNITYEVQGNLFIMNCEDAVDLFNNGNPQHRYELSIEEIDGKICFVLTATYIYSTFSYYVIAQ